MINVKSLYLPRLKRAAHHQFLKTVVDSANKCDAVKKCAASELETLSDAVKNEHYYMVQSSASDYTALIEQYDAERALIFRALRGTARRKASSLVEAQATAATEISRTFDLHDIDPAMRREQETSLVSRLVECLTGDLATHVATLGLSTDVEKLSEANTKVEELMLSRAADWSKRVVGIAKTTRKESEAAYEAFINKVDVAASYEGLEDYQDFIDVVNEEIALFKKTRSSSSQSTTAASTSSTEAENSDTDASAADNESEGKSTTTTASGIEGLDETNA